MKKLFSALFLVLLLTACARTAAPPPALAEEPAWEPTPWELPEEPAPRPIPLPDLAELPTEVTDDVNTPKAMEQRYWLLAEFPDQVSVYSGGYDMEQVTYHNEETLIRRGDHLQAFRRYSVKIQPGYLPKLCYEDVDGDGEEELLEVYVTSCFSGVWNEVLVVYDWDGEQWTDYVHDPQKAMDDFNRGHTCRFDREERMAYLQYGEAEYAVSTADPLCRLGGLLPDAAGVNDQRYDYNWADGQMVLTIEGRFVNSASDPEDWHGLWAFAVVYPIAYHADGTFAEGAGRIEGYDPPDLELEPADVFLSTLRKIWWDRERPDGTAVEDRLALCCAISDVDGDGEEELVLEDRYGRPNLTVYGYDRETGYLYEELAGFAGTTLYDNGTAVVLASNNQGLAQDCDFWPYAVYRYDPETDRYQEMGRVDAWNKAYQDWFEDFRDPSRNGEPFPDQVDADGDGVVYFLMPPGGTVREDPVDGDVYRQWRDGCHGRAEPLDLPMTALEEALEGSQK